MNTPTRSLSQSSFWAAAKTRRLAKVTAEQARKAALAAYPGARVLEVELENENGCLVYGVDLSNHQELKIDAGNGKIIHEETEDAEESEKTEENESEN